MNNQPLTIAGLGMISCLGEGAEINAAAMQSDYDGFQETEFYQPFSADKQLGAAIEMELRGIKKLSYMSSAVVSEAIQNLPDGYQGLDVIYCMPDKEYVTFFNNDDALRDIVDDTFKQTHLGVQGSHNTVYWQQRCGFVSALKQAQTLLYKKRHEYVLVVAIDSLLNSASLARDGGDLYGEYRRLLGDECSNGFIPGEAATAVLLSTPDRISSAVTISGIGEGIEHATLFNEDEVVKGNGLADAINHSSVDAGIDVLDMDFRVSSVSGEEYFFTEASLAQSKTIKKKRPMQPLWHPADNIGEVGAAVGGAILIMAYYAFIKHSAPGDNALCIISNDNSQRGAFVMRYQKEKRE